MKSNQTKTIPNNQTQAVPDQFIIIRLKSSKGLHRLEGINISQTNFGQLKQKISETCQFMINEFNIFSVEAKQQILTPDQTMLNKIPTFIDGVQLEIKEKPGQKKVEEKKLPEQPKLEKKNSSLLTQYCNHLPEQRCINCMSAEKPKSDASKIDKKNCNHGPEGKCLNCLDIKPLEEKKKKQVDQKWNCQHGPNGKCTHCMGSEFLSNVKHINLDAWLEERKLKCKGVHPPEARCNNCLPPSEISYKVKRDCKNHAPYPEAMCNKCLPQSINIKRQEYRHVDYAQFMNAQEISNFVQAWQAKGGAEQRAGFLYGYYCEDPNYQAGIRAVVEAIYEPPQKCDISSVQILPDDKMEQNVNRIAEQLGLEKIGWIFTSLNHDTFLSSEEVRAAARFQEDHRVKHQSGYTISKFITVVLRSGKDKHDEIYPEVYMVSDQAQAMEREKLFVDSERRKMMKIRAPKDEKDVIPGVICQGKQVTEFEPDFFIVNVAHGHSQNHQFSIIKNYSFPVENRSKQDENEVKKYMLSQIKKPSYVRYSDFHLLLYLSKKIDLDTVLNISYYVANEQDVIQGIDDLLKDIFKF